LNTIPYKTLKLLGWTTAILIFLSALFYLLLLLNKRIQSSKSNHPIIKALKKVLKKIIPFIHSYHPAFGTAALVTGIIHGYSLLQSVELHSGYMLWISIVMNGLTGLLMKIVNSRSFYNKIRIIHRIIMIITITLILYHVLSMKYMLF